MIDVCLSPHVKYPIRCAILFGNIVLIFTNGPIGQTTAAVMAMSSVNVILEEISENEDTETIISAVMLGG